MKFDYDVETKEHVCPECSKRYDKYNSLFKHYQRNHSKETDSDDKTVTVINSSRDNLVTAMNKDDRINTSMDKNDDASIDKNSKNNDVSIVSSENVDNGDTQSIGSIDRKDDKIAFNLALFIIGITLIYMLYRKGFFDSLLEGLRLTAQNKQRMKVNL